MLKNISKLLVLLSIIQFANAGDNANDSIKQSAQLNIDINAKNINIFENNHNCDIINDSNNNNNNVSINEILDTVSTAIFGIETTKKTIDLKRKQSNENLNLIQNALEFLKHKSYTQFIKKLNTREMRKSKIIYLLAKEKKIENLKNMEHENIFNKIEEKYKAFSKTDKKAKLKTDLQNINNKEIQSTNKTVQKKLTEQNEYMNIINNNVPAIINNLNEINDSKYIHILDTIRDTITNQQYKDAISNKINQLAGKIVATFTLQPRSNRNVNIDDHNDHSRGASLYMMFSAQYW